MDNTETNVTEQVQEEESQRNGMTAHSAQGSLMMMTARERKPCPPWLKTFQTLGKWQTMAQRK